MAVRNQAVNLRRGLLCGGGAYLLGLAVVVASGQFGLHPEAGLWSRADGIGEYLVVHLGAHLPVWGWEVQSAVLAQTAVLCGLLLGAGYLASTESDEDPLESGGSIAVGYAGGTVLGSAYATIAVEQILWRGMVAPTVLAGVVLPAVLGGVGGLLRFRLLET